MSDKPNTSQWTLTKYLNEVYIPQKQEAGLLGASAAAEYRRWARRLTAWKGREVRMRELSDALLAEAAGWLRSQGLSAKTAGNFQWCMKCIRRHCPQKMRRTFASFITAAGGDATAALRHSTRRVTEESYNDPAIANPTPPNDVLFDLDAERKGGAA